MAELPSRWLTDHASVLPSSGDALDVACGLGRHALWLAERGLLVYGVDRDEEAVRALNDEARARRLPLTADVLDLERGNQVLAVAAYDLVVVVHYLHRPLFPQLIAALRPGGVLVYETFTTAQAARGKPTKGPALDVPSERALGWSASVFLARSARRGPLCELQRVQNSRSGPHSGPTNPAFLLKPGELRDLVEPLEILAEREGDFDGRMVASVVARRSDRRTEGGS